jgi:D-alanyl-D-alanine carboxypeptidase-like protein
VALTVLVACSPTGPGAAGGPAASDPPSVEAPTPADSPRTSPEPKKPELQEPQKPERAKARLDSWDIGARTLPLRPDGFGRALRTPAELRVRRMPTVDELPPPPDARWRSSIRRIGPAVRDRMGTSWEPGCPVSLRDLRYLTVTFRGFDRAAHTGELIVRADQARGVVGVFRRLYAARFPIEQMTLPTTAERDPTPSGDGNGTGAMVCRATTGQSFYSAHAYGLAIDLNPFQNPYLKDGLVIPELAGAYLDRSWRRPGMIGPDSLPVRAFADIGWSWGGSWRTLKDYQHFSATGL